MRFLLFYHSLVSDWRYRHAHFLRGIASGLTGLGHSVQVCEPRDGWSRRNLVYRHGESALADFAAAYPSLRSRFYDPADIASLDERLDGADVVIVHDWNSLGLIRHIGRHREHCRRYRLLLYATRLPIDGDSSSMAHDLHGYDGVLAAGSVIRDAYVEQGRAERAWVWHEAADVTLFRRPGPLEEQPLKGDLVWVGNCDSEERACALEEFFVDPVRQLSLHARVHGVGYSAQTRLALDEAGICYGGWLPNYRVPALFSRFRATLHIPGGTPAQRMAGIPSIRVFEALACGIPLISAPWEDTEGLFQAGEDFLVADNGHRAARLLDALLHDQAMARELAERGYRTVMSRHTCGHRIDELMGLVESLQDERAPAARRESDVTAPPTGRTSSNAAVGSGSG